MAYLRLPYDDLDTTPQMSADCTQCGHSLSIPTTNASLAEQPSGNPAQHTVPVITVPEATVQMAAAMFLHLD